MISSKKGFKKKSYLKPEVKQARVRVIIPLGAVKR